MFVCFYFSVYLLNHSNIYCRFAIHCARIWIHRHDSGMILALKDPTLPSGDRTVTLWEKESIACVSFKVSAGYRRDTRRVVLDEGVLALQKRRHLSFTREKTFETTLPILQ